MSLGPLSEASVAASMKLLRVCRARRCLLQERRRDERRLSIAVVSQPDWLEKHKILQGSPMHHEVAKAEKQFEITSR